MGEGTGGATSRMTNHTIRWGRRLAVPLFALGARLKDGRGETPARAERVLHFHAYVVSAGGHGVYFENSPLSAGVGVNLSLTRAEQRGGAFMFVRGLRPHVRRRTRCLYTAAPWNTRGAAVFEHERCH